MRLIELSNTAWSALQTLAPDDRKSVEDAISLASRLDGRLDNFPHGVVKKTQIPNVFVMRVTAKFRVFFQVAHGEKKLMVLDVVNAAAMRNFQTPEPHDD